MRVLSFDHFEFDTSGSEEELTIALSQKGAFPHPDVKAFVAAAVGKEVSEALPEPVPFSEGMGYGLVRQYLSRFAGVRLPSPCNWPSYVIGNTNNEFHVVLEGPDSYVSYFWATSA